MPILFISNVVPDQEPFNGPGFTRSGNNVLIGITEALPEDSTIVSCRPIISFPKGPLWISGENVKLNTGKEIKILPTFNIKIIKNLFWGYLIKRIIKKWSASNNASTRNVLVYNLYTPPINAIYRICKKCSCKVSAILYDLGMPPKRLGLSKLTMLGYKLMERQAEKYIPKLDGRIVINESIIRHYSPNSHYLLIDGGINNHVISRLFPLAENNTTRFVFVLAGMLWDQNGTKLLLDCLKSHPEIDADFVFAGSGIDVPLIEDAAKTDYRIKYAGLLTSEDLFSLYAKADVLLNLRIEEVEDFHFPSKLLEYIVTGKHVLSTPIAHAERDYGQLMSTLHDITPDGLAIKIKEIMTIGKHQLFIQGRSAREFMLIKRNWNSQTKRILDYIKSV